MKTNFKDFMPKSIQNLNLLMKLKSYPSFHKLKENKVSCLYGTLSDKNSSDKIVEISAWCQKLCPTKSFVRRKFCPIFQYKSQAKIGQNCRNFGLVSKILSVENFVRRNFVR